MEHFSEKNWIIEISSEKKLLNLNLREIWRYKDLLFLFVKRDVVTVYKQTVLGPLWYLIQPLMTSVIFTIIFNNVAGIETGNINSFVFNLAGITIWNYFADCINGTADTFKKNENIFGKVYFPRIIMPLSVVFSNLIKLFIQFGIFLSFYIYFFFQGASGEFGIEILLTPVIILVMGMTGLGIGMTISSLTTKYRDLIFLVQFGVQLLMYLSAVMYPLELIAEKLPKSLASVVNYNPLAIIIDTFRKIVFENGVGITVIDFAYPVAFSVIIFLIGALSFNKTEKTFIDTI
jgi:lipopolysaccharide transport system permease protein